MEPERIAVSQSVFRVAKMIGGNDLWLIETTPSVRWGRWTQAIAYASSEEARRALDGLPPAERDAAVVVIGYRAPKTAASNAEHDLSTA